MLVCNLWYPDRLIVVDFATASFFVIPNPYRSNLIILIPGASAATKGAYLPELQKNISTEHQDDDLH